MKINVKKIIAAMLFPALLLSGCADDGGASSNNTSANTAANTGAVAEVNAAPSDVVKAVLAEVTISSSVEKGKDDAAHYYSSLDIDSVEDAAFALCGSGALPDEIAVIKCKSSDAAQKAKTALEARLDKQKELFTTYTPDEMYKLDGAQIFTKGNYAVYIALSDNSKAKSIVEGKLS